MTNDDTSYVTAALVQFHTMKQHDTVPRNKVAIDVFVREVDCG